MKENVLVVQNLLTEQHRQKLEELCREFGYQLNWVQSADEAREYAGDATIMYAARAELIPLAENLKWFSSSSAGVNTYLPVLKPETLLTNSAGAYGLSISEHIIMVTLMMLRQMPLYQKAVSERNWRRNIMVDSLYGQRITVVGTGDIGSNFARRARAFMPKSITGVSRSGSQKEDFDRCVPFEQLNEVLPQTDLLVMCVPETKLTIKMMNEERFALLPEGARFVNVGRGSAVDEMALMNALNSGHLAGAALDVFEREPLPVNSLLYQTPNLIITPHCAGMMTLEYTREKNFEMFCTNLKHWAKGEPMEHVVDKEREY